MFETICELIPGDPDYPARTRRLDILTRVLEGQLYDALPYPFHEERTGANEYIPLRDRRPSVRYPLARIVVDDSLALTFSDGHFPTLDSDHAGVRRVLSDLVRETSLNALMLDAALRGSVGSVAILLRVLRGRVFFRVLPSLHLTPIWDPEEPDALLSVTEKYKASGSMLAAQGYDIDDPQGQYWFMRRWDDQWEKWFSPWPVGEPAEPAIDDGRSVRHGLGFVPIVWVRNLPGGDDIDGGCTFAAAVDTNIEIDYQLSQAGRGLKYSSDPTLLIREPAGTDNHLIRGGGNALIISEKGDAELLEINGTAAAAVIEYVRTLREFALEGVHGNRTSADRLTTAQSGRALEMMNQGLISLADNLRVSYGGALLQLAHMVIRASNRYALRTLDAPIVPIDPATRLTLKWPRWYPPSAEDRAHDAQTLTTLARAEQISRETAVKSIADVYDIGDVTGELARIDAETTPKGTA